MIVRQLRYLKDREMKTNNTKKTNVSQGTFPKIKADIVDRLAEQAERLSTDTPKPTTKTSKRFTHSAA